MPDLLRVRDWKRIFENNRSRELQSLNWICLPNAVDDPTRVALMSHKHGAAHYGTYIQILLVASKGTPRGTLSNLHGAPLPAEVIGGMTKIDVRTVRFVLDKLLELGVLEVVRSAAGSPENIGPRSSEIVPTSSEIGGTSADIVPTSADIVPGSFQAPYENTRVMRQAPHQTGPTRKGIEIEQKKSRAAIEATECSGQPEPASPPAFSDSISDAELLPFVDACLCWHPGWPQDAIADLYRRAWANHAAPPMSVFRFLESLQGQTAVRSPGKFYSACMAEQFPSWLAANQTMVQAHLYQREQDAIRAAQSPPNEASEPWQGFTCLRDALAPHAAVLGRDLDSEGALWNTFVDAAGGSAGKLRAFATRIQRETQRRFTAPGSKWPRRLEWWLGLIATEERAEPEQPRPVLVPKPAQIAEPPPDRGRRTGTMGHAGADIAALLDFTGRPN